jgi:hypothetical protein
MKEVRVYSSEKEIEEVVRGFETCATDKSAFKHQQHLTVAVWYLQTLDTKAAVERMRTGLLRFIDHHGVPREKYSEDVTVLWIELIVEKLAKLAQEAGIVEKCNYVIENTDGTDVSRIVHKPASRAVTEESLAKS